MPNDTPARPRMRLRYLVALLAAAAAAPVIAFQSWSAIEAARLDRAFDALEARQEPLDLTQFEPKALTAEQKQASHMYAEAGKLVDGVSTTALGSVGAAIEALCGAPDSGRRQEYIGELKSTERRYATVYELLDRAAALDTSGWDDGDRPRVYSADTMRPQHLNEVNTIRVARMACGDDPDHAAGALLASLRLGRLRAPLDVRGLLTGHGLQSVLARTPPAAMLEALQHEYEREADERTLEKALIYLRARWLAYTTPGVFSDPPAAFAARRITPFEAITVRLARPLRDHTIVTELREFDDVVEAAKTPWPRKLDEAARVDRRYPRSRSRSGAVTNILNPWGTHVASAQFQLLLPVAAEALARARANIGAIAVARWQADHAGAMPASLHQLVPTYLSAPLIDPFTGEAMQYVVGGKDRAVPPDVVAARARPAGGSSYKVYSVGANRKDDGGSWEQHSDLQRARRGDPLDIGIAVAAAPKMPQSP